MSLRLTVDKEGDLPPIVVKMNGKEYSFHFDEKGIHIFSTQGVQVEMADISEHRQWLIIK